MTNDKSLLTVGAMLLAALVISAASLAGASATGANYLKMNRATSLPGVVLSPGAYTFEVLPGHVDIVRVTSTLTNRPVYMGFTTSVDRPARMAKGSALTFGEAPSGEPVPITAWFPLGSSTGHQFLQK